ncbi:MAG TPA: lytic transglycosylase domain-containing protein [Sandaracinaceae bacterium LLY-WYZ-13_1]|nr:lytic transglycosylase domain-containing protein [Sandaracinaceae bacterium LLY-WYZ-13_1]
MRRRSLALTLLAGTLVLPPAAARAQDDPLAGVARLVRRRADAEALTALGRLPDRIGRRARARYLRGRLLERRGRLQEAAEAYPVGEAAAALPEEVRRDAARRRAIALSRTGRCETARSLFEPLDDDPLVQARVAECALAAGDLERAVDELRAVVRRRAAVVDLFAARFEYAEALARTGARDEAIEVLTALIVERVEHPQAPRAEAALTQLRGGEPPELSFTQRMRRAERWMDVRRYDEALAELEAAGRPDTRARRRIWLHLKGMALYRERHSYAEAAEVLARSAALGGAHAAEDQFHAARALSRADRDLEAVRDYRRFVREHPEHRRAPEATYLAAWLELRHGRAARGERQMRRFSRSRLARRAPGLRRAATWQLALRAFERERHRAAARLFDRYADLGDGPLVRARGLYWRGRAHHERGDHERAAASYRAALEVEPLHWYALLARQRLAALGEEVPPPFPDAPAPGEAPDVEPALPEAARFYAALGLRADAREALRATDRAIRAEHGLEAVVAAYRRLGEPSRLVRLVGGPSTTRRHARPGPADRWRWDAAYPRPWPSEARTAASSVGLTPAHLYAVMRQESGFDPDAVSYADAIGLMQLLPRTAAQVAQGLGLELRREMLFDPAINMRLGAAYVGGLAERFGVPLAFAAYNAGGHNVQRWLDARGRTELDLFVEHIPFRQTRNYIRRVTTHLAHYRYLEDPDGGWPLELPTHVE